MSEQSSMRSKLLLSPNPLLTAVSAYLITSVVAEPTTATATR